MLTHVLVLSTRGPARRLGDMTRDHLSKTEIRKDALQDGVEATLHTVGQVANIVVGAASEVAKAFGGLATDLFEIRDAARRASADSPTVRVVPDAEGTTPHNGPDNGPDDVVNG